jgi:hypothetical protein
VNRIHVLIVYAVDARHIGSGLWAVFDAGVMRWWATDLAEEEAEQKAADLNVTFNQCVQRAEADRREVDPPIQVETVVKSRPARLVGDSAAGMVGPGTRC